MDTDSFCSLPDLVAQHASDFPDDPAIVLDGETITWRSLDARAKLLSVALAERGALPGTLVTVWSKNPRAFVELLLATLRAGCVFVPLPTDLKVESLRTMVDSCAPSLLVLDGSGKEKLNALSTDRHDRCVHYTELHENRSNRSVDFLAGPDASATVLFSSGTTNNPKGVVHTHRARFLTQRRFIRRFGITRRTVTLIASPLYTSLTWASLLPTLAAGGTSAILPSFDAKTFLLMAKRLRADLTMLVPMQYAMLREHREELEDALGGFRALISAGSKLDAGMREDLMTLCGGKLIELLGSTETDALCCLPDDAPKSKWGSVGLPLQDVSVKIVATNDDELSLDEFGEIVVSTPSLMRQYCGSARLSDELFWVQPTTGERFYRLGDVGLLDSDGYLWVRGRSKDTIKTAGFSVHADDIEETLAQHPHIQEVAVVGRPHARLGEVPIAFVTTDVESLSASEICRWVNGRLNDRQRVYSVYILERLPVNASGKVVKAALQACTQD